MQIEDLANLNHLLSLHGDLAYWLVYGVRKLGGNR